MSTPVKAAASYSLDLVHAIVTTAIKCRDNTDETEIPFAISVKLVETGYAGRVWRAIAADGSCGVRMEPVPDHRDLERAVLLFFRMANAEG